MSRTQQTQTPDWVINFGKGVLITMHESALANSADYRSILTKIPEPDREQVLRDIMTFVQNPAMYQVRVHCFKPITVDVTDVETYQVGEVVSVCTGPLSHRIVLGLGSHSDERFQNTVFGFQQVQSIDTEAKTVTVIPFMGFRILRPSVKKQMIARRQREENEEEEEEEVEKEQRHSSRKSRRGGRR